MNPSRKRIWARKRSKKISRGSEVPRDIFLLLEDGVHHAVQPVAFELLDGSRRPSAWPAAGSMGIFASRGRPYSLGGLLGLALAENIELLAAVGALAR